MPLVKEALGSHTYKVVEKFVSIDGEGPTMGQLAVFIRFGGCNLSCDYCDSMFAMKEGNYTEMTGKQILDYILETGVTNVTLTGGEPLIQENITDFIILLAHYPEINVSIETNGTVDIDYILETMIRHTLDYNVQLVRPSFVLDYKSQSSGFGDTFHIPNFSVLKPFDTIKFVVGDYADLYEMKEVVEKYSLVKKCNIYVSPIFGKIEPVELVAFIKKYKLNGVNVQVQLHKIIWDPNMQGV